MIHISSTAGRLPIASRGIERAAEAALRHESAQGDLSIALSDDGQLQQLNREYLGIDAPTDVLSFPAAESDPESGAMYLGDIVISMEHAQKQALAAGHPLQAEVQLLVVHGVLHLLGYDHAKPSEKSRMWAAQAAILNSIGLGSIEVRES